MKTGEQRVRASNEHSRRERKLIPKLAFAGLALLLFLILAGLAAATYEIYVRYSGDTEELRSHREELLKALDAFILRDKPQPALKDSDIEWPELSVEVRLQQDKPPPAEPYVRGGKLIPDTNVNYQRGLVKPDYVPPGLKRIFIIGESAAFGYPYAYEQSMGGILNAGLMPLGWAAVNAADVGRPSSHQVPVVRRIVDHHRPDALIIFNGNNEWIHWKATGWQSGKSPMELRLLRFAAKHSRAVSEWGYEVFKEIALRTHRGKEKLNEFQGDHVLQGSDYAIRFPLDDEVPFNPPDWFNTKREYLENYETNLRLMAGYALERGVRVILVTMPYNYKLSPAWKMPQPECYNADNCDEMKKNIETIAALKQAGQLDAALEKIEQTLALDDRPAILHYLKAETLEAQGKPAEAERAYAQSRENMIGNLGSILSINDTIRRVAGETGAELLDAVKLFDDFEHARGRYFNEDLVIDDCHPSPLGQRLLAEALAGILIPRTDPAPP